MGTPAAFGAFAENTARNYENLVYFARFRVLSQKITISCVFFSVPASILGVFGVYLGCIWVISGIFREIKPLFRDLCRANPQIVTVITGPVGQNRVFGSPKSQIRSGHTRCIWRICGKYGQKLRKSGVFCSISGFIPKNHHFLCFFFGAGEYFGRIWGVFGVYLGDFGHFSGN